jgi:hypothetical protein
MDGQGAGKLQQCKDEGHTFQNGLLKKGLNVDIND